MAGLLVLFMYVIGILYIVMGTLMVFVPEIIRKKIVAKMKNAPIKKMSIIPIIIGVLLVLAASYNRFRVLVALLGLLALAKGIAGIAATDKMEKMRDWAIEKMKTNMYRAWGVIIIILGSIILTGI